MLTLRPSHERGRARHGWLTSAFTFSFAEYYDEAWMGFRGLRVINEDYIKAGTGFPTHPHRDMEIVTYVLSGELEHTDSTGHKSVIKHGIIQRMTAGRGIRHSEFNHSKTEGLHLLQIWILPEAEGLDPSYEEKRIDGRLVENQLGLLAARDPKGKALAIHADVSIYACQLAAGREQEHRLTPGRHAWVQVASGKISVNGITLEGGDGLAVSDEKLLTFTSQLQAEFLVFDLA